MSPRPRRDEPRTDLQQRIMSAARQQIARSGASALSLRAIARELNITAPAIYNYFADRDGLVTALVIEAYRSFGDSQLAARDAVSPDDLRGRLIATGVAYRQWALANPERYQLIFGTPIPGYVLPREEVFPAGARSFGALVSVVEALRAAGRLRAEGFPPSEPGHDIPLAAWKRHGGPADILSFAIALVIWSRVHGLVSLEVGGHLPSIGPTADALYLYQLESLSREFIKE